VALLQRGAVGAPDQGPRDSADADLDEGARADAGRTPADLPRRLVPRTGRRGVHGPRRPAPRDARELPRHGRLASIRPAGRRRQGEDGDVPETACNGRRPTGAEQVGSLVPQLRRRRSGRLPQSVPRGTAPGGRANRRRERRHRARLVEESVPHVDQRRRCDP